MKSKVKKICIVVSSLGQGGAEKSGALLSVMLHNLGHDIYIVSVLDHIDYHYEGTLYNLGVLKKNNDSVLGRISRLNKFKAFLVAKDIEIIIDNRSRVQAYREFIISKFIYKVPTIYVVHSFNAKSTFTPYKWLNKYLYRNAYMTAVSEASTLKYQKLFGLKKIRTIYNGFDFEDIKNKSNRPIEISDKPYILFYGRLEDQPKNIKLLLDAYKISQLPDAQVKLLILGGGDDFEMLQLYSAKLALGENVIFKAFTPNPYPYVKHSRFMVLSSRYEGFPMVIPETLSIGIPVVAVNCESGPREVIDDAKNGLLVENHNPKKLSEAMNTMAFNKDLYETCARNASESVAHLSHFEIAKKWQNLIQEIGNE